MVLKETLLSISKEGYKNGLEDGIEKERERILKLIYEYGIKHNSHPYFIDVMRLVDPEKDY
jgi:hypothetical protein